MFAVALTAGTARASAIVSIPDLPEECREFAWVPADARDDTLAWHQLLSLASCLQDGSVYEVDSSEDLGALVTVLTRSLVAPSTIYLGALQEAPGPMQLRAAYQFGMAHVALIVRARSSVADPALRVSLEPMLAPSLRAAWISFSVIDRAVSEDPSLAPDDVTRTMVRSARAMLAVLPRPEERDRGPPLAAN